MQLKILVPSGVFVSVANVARIVVMTPAGSFGLLPHRLDCATVLTPGLLTYAIAAGEEVHLAVDTGVLVKTGADVLVCVRHAIAGADLGHLRQAVEQEMLHLNDEEKSNRTRLAHLESGLIRAFVELQRV
ncbi:MAG TPA: F0F1 ATP synthase subunit epsilon [Steroidobacteraceae bacterium]|nr:F0F1 ATP synthase subunit epsilon [Steroidobacteraceae bacterium]